MANLNQVTDIISGSFTGDGSGITTLGTITSGDLTAVLPTGTVSSSVQIAAVLPVGSVSASAQISLPSVTGYVANEHIDHSSVTLTAGSGLSGGGDITTNRTFTLDTGSAHFTNGVGSQLDGGGF